MRLRSGAIYLPLWAQMTIISLIVSVAALLSISLVVGLHTWGDGKQLSRSKLNLLAGVYAMRLRDTLDSLVSESSYLISRDMVTDAINSHTARNISIATENAHMATLSVYARSIVKTSEGYRSLLVTDRQMDQVYTLVLSDESASLSAVLASLELLSPLLDSGFGYEIFMNTSAIITGPVLTQPPKGEPFYSLSITVPISRTAPVYYGIQGYATFVLDTDKLIDKITSDIELILPDGDVDVVILKQKAGLYGFEYAASNNNRETTLTDTFYQFKQYPAIGHMFETGSPDDSQISSKSWMSTHTLTRKSAAVGCARISTYNLDWVICAQTSRSSALESVRSLRNRVIGLCFGMLGFILLMVIPTGRIMTSPLYSIYEQMEIPRKKSHSDNFEFSDQDKALPPVPSTSPIRSRKTVWQKFLWFMGFGSAGGSGGGGSASADDCGTPRLNIDSENFQVPQKIQPLNRKFYCDELDRLVEEYNGLTDELNTQYHYLEDQVKDRTMEAQAARLEAEKANLAKSQFIANITHELRTPLNGIMGMTSVTLSEESIPKIQTSLGIILRSGRTLMKLLNELLAFSRSQVDMEPKITEFTPAEIFAHLQNMIDARSDAEKKDMPLKFMHRCDPAVLLNSQFLGDGHRISQICLHLMSNAIKFSCTHNEVTAVIRYVNEQSPVINVAPYASHYSTLANIGTMEIAIIDSGKGIDETQLATIFEPFVQGDDAFTKKYDGTGLGMSMCKQLAGTIGASLGVWSSIGKGTCCILEVPVVAGRGTPASPPLDINRNGMYYTASTSSGTVTKFTHDPRSAKRKSALSAEDSVYESGASNSMQTGAVSVVSANTSGSKNNGGGEQQHQHQSHHLGHHPKRHSVVSSIFSGLLRGHHESHSSLRLSNSHPRQGHQPSGSTSVGSHQDLERSSGSPMVPASTGNISPTHSQLVGPVVAASVPPPPAHASSGSRKLVPIYPEIGHASPSSSFNDISDVKVQDNELHTFLETQHPDYKVLVADDNALNLEIMVKMLRRVGIVDVHTATDGEAVVKLVEQSIKDGFHYSVIFMDLSMPRLDGFQATHIIRRTLAYPYPIVALTGYSDQRTKRMCESSNIQEVLVKPVLRDALIAVLVKYDSNEKPVS